MWVLVALLVPLGCLGLSGNWNEKLTIKESAVDNSFKAFGDDDTASCSGVRDGDSVTMTCTGSVDQDSKVIRWANGQVWLKSPPRTMDISGSIVLLKSSKHGSFLLNTVR